MMTRRLLWVAGVFVSTLVLSQPAGSIQDLDGQPAPKFSLKNTKGNTVSLSDFEGNVVLLDFWATWCGPCTYQLPFLDSLAAKYRNRGLVVVGLHVDDRRPPPSEVEEYLLDKRVHYTNLISTWNVDEAFQIQAVPTSFIIDREGTIQRTHVGFDARTAPEKIEAHVREVLGLP